MCKTVMAKQWIKHSMLKRTSESSSVANRSRTQPVRTQKIHDTIFAVFWRRLIVSILKSVHSFFCHFRSVNFRKFENSEKAYSLTKQTTSITNLPVTFHCFSKLVQSRFLSKKMSENWTFISQFYNILQIFFVGSFCLTCFLYELGTVCMNWLEVFFEDQHCFEVWKPSIN